MTKSLKLLVVAASTAFLATAPQGWSFPQRYDFGLLPLESKVDSVPRWAVKETCSTSYAGFGDCELFDARGIQYIIFDGILSAKEFDVSPENDNDLPYGLVRGRPEQETIKDISRKLGLRFRELDPGIYDSDPIQPDKYDGMTISLKFDAQGKLQSIRLSSDYV